MPTLKTFSDMRPNLGVVAIVHDEGAGPPSTVKDFTSPFSTANGVPNHLLTITAGPCNAILAHASPDAAPAKPGKGPAARA